MRCNSLARSVAAILGLVLCGQTSAIDRRHDGTWWVSLGQEERLGYLEGFAVCAVYDAGDPRLKHGGFHSLAPKITAFYGAERSRRVVLVSTVLLDLGPKEPFRPEPSGAEHYAKKYGFYDGLYWQQVEAEQRLGLVTGYLDCWKQFKLKGSSFSREAQWYVERVSNWYGIDRTELGTARPDRISKMVPDVLRQFKD